MKKTIYLILTIITLIFIVVFTLQNNSAININLLFWSFKTSLALLIFSLFGLGIVTAIFVLTPTIIALKSAQQKDKGIISKLKQTNVENSEMETENE
jgi:uncharacterized integral membrane protein